MNITKEELVKILGLGEDATDEQIVTAIKAGAQAIEELAKMRADDDDEITVEDLKATIAKTPVTVPLSARTPGHMKETPPAGEVSEELRQIALNCGVSPEIFKK